MTKIIVAHCIHPKFQREAYYSSQDIVALFGSHALYDPFEVDKLVLIPDKIITSEEYDWNSNIHDADIALLKFNEGKININHAYINPICIWDSIDDPLAKEGVLVGVERTGGFSEQREAEIKNMRLTIRYNDECLEETPSTAEVSSNRTFCAASWNGSVFCNGDSGAGLYIKIDGIYYLKGLLSASAQLRYDYNDPNCDSFSAFGVYTYIYKYIEWIRQKTQGDYATSAKG